MLEFILLQTILRGNIMNDIFKMNKVEHEKLFQIISDNVCGRKKYLRTIEDIKHMKKR